MTIIDTKKIAFIDANVLIAIYFFYGWKEQENLMKKKRNYGKIVG